MPFGRDPRRIAWLSDGRPHTSAAVFPPAVHPYVPGSGVFFCPERVHNRRSSKRLGCPLSPTAFDIVRITCYNGRMIKALTATVLAEDSVGYETPYLGQHGISLLIDAETPLTRIRILMDVAQHPEPLLHNMALMSIDPASIDTIVLTHCHYDHTQGLVRVIEAIGKPGLPVVAHPDLFRPNFETTPRLRPIGVPPGDNRERVVAAGAHLLFARSPLQLADGLTTSGEIPRTTHYEGANAGLYTLENGARVPDPMIDDLSIFALVEGVGIVVFSGCSHAGIVNIARHARTIFSAGITAVMGGLHLITADTETIDTTVAGLREENVERVLAGHCTGFAAQTAFHREFGNSFAPLHTGLCVTW